MTGKRSSQTSPTGSPTSGDSSSKDLDRFLPIANVSRIMKKSLPTNAKVSKEAKETIQECVSEFISFITGEASDKCQREKRKTINGDDLLWAMTTLGFENYVGPLKVYLNKYRETEGEKNSMVREEDQESFLSSNSIININQGVNEIRQGFHGEYYAIGDQGIVNRHGNRGEDLVISGGAFNIGKNKIQELGDGNAKRAMATHLHHGILEW